MNTQLELVGGPLHGQCHELNFGFPPPEKIGLPDEEDKTLIHWYASAGVNNNVYHFVGTKNRYDYPQV